MPRRRRTPPEQEPQPPAEPDDEAQPVRVLDANQVVAYNFRAARELRGWTQDHVAYLLAQYLGQQLPKASISAIERSLEGDRRREFDAQELVAFALTFDLPIVWPMVQRSCRHWSERSLQCRRHSAPRRPIDQLDRVDNRDHRPCRDLPDASDIAGGDHVGLYLLDMPDFARAQHLRKIRMKNVVGSC